MKQLRRRGFTGQTDTTVTVREPQNRALARKAAAEGFVLLKNEGAAMPVPTSKKIALYGAGAVKTIKGGTGSGDVNERDCVSIWQGLANAGYEITSGDWLVSYDKLYTQARLDWRKEILDYYEAHKDMPNAFFESYCRLPFAIPAGDMLNEEKAASDGADTAVFVLSRIAGEGADRKPAAGDFLITEEEHALIAQICRCYPNVVLVINTGGVVDLQFTEEFPQIRAILQYMQAGQEGGNAFADVFSGKITPSGKMTDTWALKYEDYPNASTFSFLSGNVYKEEYTEGIYVGYRYFDTFDVPVRYSFGHGLSYTEFAIKTTGIQAAFPENDRPRAEVTVEVTNAGTTFSGKEVVQIYVSCPQGRLSKEYRRLAAYAKTKELNPGEKQILTISFPLYQLASFDEASASYVLEAGTYGIWVGNSLANAKLSCTMELDQEVCLAELDHICPLKQPLQEITPDPQCMAEKEAGWKQDAAGLPKVFLSEADFTTELITYSKHGELTEGEALDIVNSLTTDQLIALATGDPSMGQGSALGSAGQTVPGAAAETVKAAEAEGVASIVLADGPAGLRLNQKYQVKDGQVVRGSFMESLEHGFFAEPVVCEGAEDYYQYCTAIPVGTLLAQTWNTELIKEVGQMIGGEMNLFEVTLWLAPGMNIHRNPLCGRNFEYYSEDPLVAGTMAAAMTAGVQSVPGCGTTIKHFCLNNQEDNRMGSDSVVSERALREIYLKNFEIAIKSAQPMSIMTSYNLINGIHAANCYDTCTKAARDEWGFAGAIMTDWTTTTASTAGECTAAGCMRAGNDMVMPGDPTDHDSIRTSLANGTLTLDELKRCICNVVNIALQSNQYENAESYRDQFGTEISDWIQVR